MTFILQSNSGDRPAVYYATENLKNGKTEKTELPHATFHNVSAYFLGGEYSLYYTDQSFLYGYDVKTKKSTELMDFLNSDCSGSLLDNAQILSPELFVTYGYDEAFGSNVLAIIEQIPKEQVKEKNLITLSVLGDGSSARSDVIRFNRSSDEYRVVIREYNPDKYIPSDGSEYLYSDLIKIVVDEMNNDILSGNAPDLLLVNEFIPLDSYAAKGMLVDLYEFFDADDEIRREDYLMNILQATEINGKLYHIMPSFQVNTYAAKTANMNGMTSWTMEKHPERIFTSLVMPKSACNYRIFVVLCGTQTPTFLC